MVYAYTCATTVAYFMSVPTYKISITPSCEISISASRRKWKMFSTIVSCAFACVYFTLVYNMSFLECAYVCAFTCAYFTGVNQVLVSTEEIHDFKFIQKCSAACSVIITLGISSVKYYQKSRIDCNKIHNFISL